MPNTLDNILTVRSAVVNSVPFVKGTRRVTKDQCSLFYKNETGGASFVNLATANPIELNDLASACQVGGATANGHVNGKGAGTSRPAVNMPASQFAVKFDPYLTGLVHDIQNTILTIPHGPRALDAELASLHVLGKGASLRVPKNTQDAALFGTLIVTFPTHFLGGSLVLRQSGEEWEFHKEYLLQDRTEPHVSFAAFYSDVEFEIASVKEGHRVVLTYELFHVEDDSDLPGGASTALFSGPPVSLHTAVQNLLADPDFLPQGGLIGFGLQFAYPLQMPHSNPRTPIHDVITHLKGADAITKQVLESLGLDVSLMAIYEGDEDLSLLASDSLIRVSLDQEKNTVDDSRGWFLFSENRGVPIFDDYVARLGKVGQAAWENGVAVTWITHLTAKTQFKDSFISSAGGNGSSGESSSDSDAKSAGGGSGLRLDQMSADLCMMSAVGPFGQRQGGAGVQEILERYVV